ncbi:MAG TPA: HPr family phosphocarrier protein [Rhizomicrobium sp.]|jgi:phosphocarrier protein|nr:HPr family phosphocarrier protein [Rhizomicrobium sp.]
MDDPTRARVKIVNEKGLHARASAKIVEATARFKSHITVTYCEQTVDADSILDLMMLGAGQGKEIVLRAEGEDAEDAITAMVALVEARFGEDR